MLNKSNNSSESDVILHLPNQSHYLRKAINSPKMTSKN